MFLFSYSEYVSEVFKYYIICSKESMKTEKAEYKTKKVLFYNVGLRSKNIRKILSTIIDCSMFICRNKYTSFNNVLTINRDCRKKVFLSDVVSLEHLVECSAEIDLLVCCMELSYFSRHKNLKRKREIKIKLDDIKKASANETILCVLEDPSALIEICSRIDCKAIRNFVIKYNFKYALVFDENHEIFCINKLREELCRFN